MEEVITVPSPTHLRILGAKDWVYSEWKEFGYIAHNEQGLLCRMPDDTEALLDFVEKCFTQEGIISVDYGYMRPADDTIGSEDDWEYFERIDTQSGQYFWPTQHFPTLAEMEEDYYDSSRNENDGC